MDIHIINNFYLTDTPPNKSCFRCLSPLVTSIFNGKTVALCKKKRISLKNKYTLCDFWCVRCIKNSAINKLVKNFDLHKHTEPFFEIGVTHDI